MFEDFSGDKKKRQKRLTISKMDRTKIQFKGNKQTCGTTRTRYFWLVVEDIRKVENTWQGI